jgi:hypothetical protein
VLTDLAAQQLALTVGLQWSDQDRDVLAPVVDGVIVWLDDDELEEVARPVVAQLWADELREDVERALTSCLHDRFVARKLIRARADLDLGPAESRLALAVVRQGAIDLTGDAMLPGRCLCCVDDVLAMGAAPTVQALVVAAAAGIALRDDPEFGLGIPTDAAREHARQRIRAIAALAECSLPRAAAALSDLVAGPLPAPSDDAVWRAAVAERNAAIAAWN